MIKLKRVYEPAGKDDGYRVLVDRLWPRGVTKAKAKLGVWLKDIAPSDTLRQWFGHDPKKWPTFEKKYRAELKKNETAVSELRGIIKKHKTVTLVYGAKDERYNQAAALKNFI